MKSSQRTVEVAVRYVTRLLATFALAVAGAALAQGYPTRPIKLVVPWPPGQSTDITARMLAEKLALALGQPVVVDNRPGAGGIIGTEFVSKAAPDGYTLLAGSSGPMTISPVVQKTLYDPLKDFAPISLLQTGIFVLVVNPSVPAPGAKELVALLRANPGRYSYSSAGNASTQHLCLELFNFMAQVKATHVPYKGSAPSITDVVGGQVAYTMDTWTALMGSVKGGRLRALAVSTARRSAVLPDVPTIAEAADLPGYDMSGWQGLLAPAGTPRELISRLSAETRKILRLRDVIEQYLVRGVESTDTTPEEFAEYIRQQLARYGAIVKQANVRLE